MQSIVGVNLECAACGKKSTYYPFLNFAVLFRVENRGSSSKSGFAILGACSPYSHPNPNSENSMQRVETRESRRHMD